MLFPGFGGGAPPPKPGKSALGTRLRKGYLLWQKGWGGGPRGGASPYKALSSTPGDFPFRAVFLPSTPFLRLTRQVDNYNCSFVNSPTVENVGLNVTIGSTSNDWQEKRKKLTNCRFLFAKKLIAFKLKRADCVKNRLSQSIISLRGFPRYSKTCLWINWIPKIMVQFCHLRLLYLGIEMDWNLKVGPILSSFNATPAKIDHQ